MADEDKNLADPKTQQEKQPQDPSNRGLDLNIDLFEESRQEQLTPAPVEHKNVDVQSYLDYVGEDLNLLTDDAEKLRARSQSHWGQMLGFVNQAVVGELVGGTIEAAGYLLDWKGIADLARGTEDEWGNWFSDIGKAIKEGTREVTPIYTEEPGEFSPTDLGWWMKNGVSVASTLSLMIPSGAAMKGLGFAGRTLSKGAGLLNRGLNVAKKFDKASDFTQSATRGLTQAFLSRHAENMMESSQVFDELREKYLDRGLSEEQATKQASKGAKSTYLWDSGMILQDIAQYTLLNRFTGGLGSKALSPTKATQAAEGALSKLPGGRTASLVADFIGEGAEEAYQYIGAEEGKYLADVQAGIRDPSDFSDRMREYMNDGELLTSAFFGGIGSTVMQTAGPRVMEMMSNRTGGYNQDPLEYAKAQVAFISQNDKSVRSMREKGLENEADQQEKAGMVETAIRNLEQGRFKGFRSSLDQIDQLSDEDIQEGAQKYSQGADVALSPQKVREKTKLFREVADETKKVYDKLKSKYGQEVAGRATRERMDANMYRNLSKQKESEVQSFKSDLPEYSDLSANGKSIVDLRMEKEGLDRAEKGVKKVLEEVEADANLQAKWQSVLENIQRKRKNVEQDLNKQKKKEYDQQDMENDRQIMDNMDSVIEDGTKIVSEREFANQYANASLNAYEEKINIAKDKKKQEERKQKAQQTQDFKQDTIAADDTQRPLKKGEPVLYKGMPGQYEGTFQRNGETHHRIKDLSRPNETWEVSDKKFSDDVQRRQRRSDIADRKQKQKEEEDLSSDQFKFSEEQKRRAEQETQESQKKKSSSLEEKIKGLQEGDKVQVTTSETVELPDGGTRERTETETGTVEKMETSSGTATVAVLDNAIGRKFFLETNGEVNEKVKDISPVQERKDSDSPFVFSEEQKRQAEQEADQPTPTRSQPSAPRTPLTDQEVDQLRKVIEANTSTIAEIGGQKDIMVPENGDTVSDEDVGKPSSPNRQSKIQNPLTLSVASTRNPQSFVRNQLRRGEITENSETWKDAQARTEFLENPDSPVDTDGSYKYFVRTEIDEQLFQEMYPETYEKWEKGIDLTQDEIANKVPIKTNFYNTDGTPVTRNDRQVYSYLHTVSWITPDRMTEDVQQAADKLYQEREAIVASHQRGTHREAYITRKGKGHFLEGDNIEKGNFDSYNNVAEVLGRDAENVELAILDSGGNYTNQQGQPHDLFLRLKQYTPENAGAIYAAIRDPSGQVRPMRLFVDNISEAESEVIWRVYRNLLSKEDGTRPSDVITEDIKTFIRNSDEPRVNQIGDVYKSLNDLSHKELLEFLVYEGKEQTKEAGESALYTEWVDGKLRVKYGNNSYLTEESIGSGANKAGFKEWIRNNRRRQITRRFIGDDRYKRYLIDNNIVATTAAVTENSYPLQGVSTEVGHFSEPTEKGDIDHVEDTNRETEEEDGEQPGRSARDIFQRMEITEGQPLSESMSQRGIQRMMNRLQERFNIPNHIINDSSVKWAAKIENGTVIINMAHATEDSPFHEYAHPLVQQIKNRNIRLYVNLVEEMRKSPQGREILGRVQENYQDLNPEQRTDEAIVQLLGELSANNLREDATGLKGMISDLWEMIKNAMRRLLGRDVSVNVSEISPTSSLADISEMLSDDLTEINLSGTPITAEQRPSWMNSEQYHDWVDSMTYMLLNDNVGKDISDFGEVTMDSIRDLVVAEYEKLRQEEGQEYLTNQYRKVIEDITTDGQQLDPESDLLIAVHRKLRSFGFTPSEEVRPEERDSRLNIRASYEFSNKDKASTNVKLMMSMLPKLNSARKVDNRLGKGKHDYKLSPHTGLPQFHNFSDTWNVVQTTLADTVETFDENGNVEDLYEVYHKKLLDAKDHRPELKFLINHLENSPPYKKYEFAQALSLASQDYLAIIFRRQGENLTFRMGDADTQSVVEKITDDWEAQYKNKLSRTVKDKEGRLWTLIDKEKANNLVERFETLQTEATKRARDVNQVPDDLRKVFNNLLSDTGINVSDRTLDLLIDRVEGKNLNEMEKFNKLLRGARGTSIRFIYKEAPLSLEKRAGKPLVSPEKGEKPTVVKEEAFIRRLAEAESYFQNNLVDSTILGPENKPFWKYSRYNAMFKKAAEWRKNPDALRHLLTGVYNQNSKWAEWLLDSQENRENFRIRNLASIRQEFSSDPGRKNTDLDITDLQSIHVNGILKGFFPLPARADNTTDYWISGPSLAGQDGTVARISGDNVELTDEGVQILKDYLLDEISRIKKAEKQVKNENEQDNLDESEWVKDYHFKYETNENGDRVRDDDGNLVKNVEEGNAFSIYLFPSFNTEHSSKFFHKDGTVITPNSENWDDGTIENLIRQAFDRRLTEDMVQLKREGVVRKSQGGPFENVAIDADILAEYKKDAKSEHGAIQAALMDYTFNGIMANQEWFKLFGGDIASYESRDDFQKRATAPGSTGLTYIIRENMSPTYNSAVVEDVITESELLSDENVKEIAEYTGKSQEEVREVLKDFGAVDRADAQAWITPEVWRDRMMGYGEWTKDHQDAYERMQSGKSLPEDMELFMQPLKTAHTEMKIEAGNSIFHYNKQSEAVLHPELAETLGLGNLLKAMRDQNVDHVVVESGKKSGARGITKITDDNGNFLDSSNIELNGTSLSKRFLFLQQELPTKGMAPAKEGSQVRKNIFDGIFNSETYEMPNGEKIDGSELSSRLHGVLGAISDKGLQEVKEIIEYNEDTGYNESRLRNFLKDSFTRRGNIDNLIGALDEKYPFDALPQVRFSIEQQLASMIDKRVVDVRHDTGGAFIQMSDVGFTQQELTQRQKEEMLWVDESAKDGLKPPRIENKQFKGGQIFLPHKVLDQLPDVDRSELKRMLQKINTGISYRIPNQKHSSNDVVQIAGVLPKSMGDTVIVYDGATTKYGSDFDIDKLNIMLPNYYIKDGEVHVEEFIDIDTSNEEELKRLYRQQYAPKMDYLVYLESQLDEYQRNLLDKGVNLVEHFEREDANEIVLDSKRTVTLRDYNSLREQVAEMPTEDEFVDQYKGASVYEVNSKRALQNRKLELYRTMLSNKNTYLEMMRPTESGWLEEMIRENREKKEYDGDLEMFSPTAQAQIRKRFVDANSAVGQLANHVTDHSFSEGLGLYLNRKDRAGDISPFYLGVGKSTEVGGQKATDLSSVEDVDGNRIVETLSAMLTANVDATKNPYIADGNFNLFTNPIAILLVRGGASRRFVVDFIGQDILRRYTHKMNQYSGRTSKRDTVKGVGQVSPIESEVYRLTSQTDRFQTTINLNEVSYTEKVGEEEQRDLSVEEIDPKEVLQDIKDNGASVDTDLQMLKLFETWRGLASSLTEAVQASKADVNGTEGSITAAYTAQNRRAQVAEDRIIGNFENKFKGTFLGRFYENSVIASQEIFGADTFLHQTQAVKDLVDDIATDIGQAPLTDPDLAFRLNSEAYAYLISGTEFTKTPEELNDMFTGKDSTNPQKFSMGRRLMRAKGSNNQNVRENSFIQYLGYKLDVGENNFDFVYGQGSKQLSSEARNDLTEGWRELLNHDRKNVRQFARDLGIYAYYSSGFRRNLTSFYELMPVELTDQLGITEAIREYQRSLNTDTHPLAGGKSQILKNLSDNPSIVPDVSPSSNHLTQLEGMSKKEIFGMVPSGLPDYLVADRDGNDGNPVGKPLVKVGDKLFEYRGVGTKKVEDTDGNMKDTKVFVYTPTSDMGVKEGRFRIKEYYKGSGDIQSAFEQNNPERNEKVEKVVKSLGTSLNYTEGRDTGDGFVQQEKTASIDSLLNEVEELSDEQKEEYKQQFEEISDQTTPREFVESIKDNIKCK